MYYILDCRTDKEVGNVFPQIGFINMQDAFSIKVDSFEKNIPILKAKLERKAKITDVLSQVSIMGEGILMNKKVKKIIEQYNIIKHRYYSVSLIDKKENIDYFWLKIYDASLIHKINYEKSVFYWKNPLREGIINLTSYDDYLLKEEENKDNICWLVDIDKIVLNNDFDKKLDLFTFSLFSTDIFISERLKNALIESEITGIDIKEANILLE